MIVRMLLLLLTVLSVSFDVQASLWNDFKSVFVKNKSEDCVIDVLLVHDVEKAHLEIQGKYSLYNPHDNTYLSTRYIGKARQLETMRDGLKWGEAFPGIYQIHIKPEDKSTIALVDQNEYTGSLYIYDTEGVLGIVNQVPVETYVNSILSNIDISSLEPEIISALAIVARTNAYFQVANPKAKYWAVDAQKAGYVGVPKPSENAQRAETAVRVTKDMIMSRTGVYEGVSTPFLADFGYISPQSYSKNFVVSKLTLDEANALAQSGMHAAQILAKAFPGTTIVLRQ